MASRTVKISDSLPLSSSGGGRSLTIGLRVAGCGLHTSKRFGLRIDFRFRSRGGACSTGYSRGLEHGDSHLGKSVFGEAP